MTRIATGRVQQKQAWEKKGWRAIDVTVKSAQGGARALAPTWDMVMGYKKGTLTQEQYTEKYMAILRKSQTETPRRWAKTLETYEKIVFLCYCPSGNFCHRHLLAAEFVRYGREVLGMDVQLVSENAPRPSETSSKTYAGIGSRKTPANILASMKTIASDLEKAGYTLRSGGAKGADSAFEAGVKSRGMKEIYRTQDCEDWCLDRVAKYVPSNRPPLSRMKPFIQKLLGRNMKQVFGPTGDTPVDFVIAWTSDGEDSGGTGYAIRAARDAGIPVYNLYNADDLQKVFSLAAGKENS